MSVLAGALLGLAISIALGYGFYRGSRALNLPRFFRWTGVLLVFIAAGLLSAAVHEFVEIGWITIGTAPAFDISAILSHEHGLGLFLRAIFGYSSSPELITVATWIAYVVIVLTFYLRPTAPRRSVAVAEPAGAAPGAEA